MDFTATSSLLISDRVAYVCACDLVDQEGDDAVLLAAERADACQAEGDAGAYAYWRRVESAIQILLLEDAVGDLH
jgi:hypothetical protein